jgi:hypothetical protein
MTGDAFYEWLLSDHPEAKAEREARRAEYCQRERANAAAARAWAAKINATPDAPQNLRDLAVTSVRLAGQAETRAEAASAEPDDARVARLRAEHENSIRAGEPGCGYRYPEHLTGPDAARYPRPPEPEAGS